MPPNLATADKRLIVIRPAITTQLDAQRLVGLKSEIDGILGLAGYDPERDAVVLCGDLMITGGPHCVEIVKWASGDPNVSAVRPENSATVLSSVRAWQKTQKDGDPPPASFQYVRHFAPDEAEWLASLPFVMTVSDLEVTVTSQGLLNGPRNEVLMSQQGEALIGLVLTTRSKPERAEVLRYHTTEQECAFGASSRRETLPVVAQVGEAAEVSPEPEDGELKARAMDADITTSARRRARRLEGTAARGDSSDGLDERGRLAQSRARHKDHGQPTCRLSEKDMCTTPHSTRRSF